MELLLALGVYAWAGLWVAWPMLSSYNTKGKHLILVLISFLLCVSLWGILLPVYVIKVDQERRRNS